MSCAPRRSAGRPVADHHARRHRWSRRRSFSRRRAWRPASSHSKLAATTGRAHGHGPPTRSPCPTAATDLEEATTTINGPSTSSATTATAAPAPAEIVVDVQTHFLDPASGAPAFHRAIAASRRPSTVSRRSTRASSCSWAATRPSRSSPRSRWSAPPIRCRSTPWSAARHSPPNCAAMAGCSSRAMRCPTSVPSMPPSPRWRRSPPPMTSARGRPTPTRRAAGSSTTTTPMHRRSATPSWTAARAPASR